MGSSNERIESKITADVSRNEEPEKNFKSSNWVFFKKLYQRLHQVARTLIGKIILLTLIFMVIGTIGFYLLELPKFTLMQSFYWTVITITTIGFGDIAPLTMGGQALAIVLAFFGVALISLTFATILEIALDSRFFQNRRLLRMVNKMREITLIVGYNARIQILIEELTTEGNKVVLVNNEPIPESWDSTWGPYIQGDPKEDAVLQKAGVNKAKKALISLDDDGDTLLTVLSIQALNPNCYTIAEVTEKSNVQHFKRVNCHQILCKEEILGKFLNITLMLPDLYDAYNELISMAGKEIYQMTKITDYLDKPFEEAIPLIKKKHDALLIGFIRDDQTLLNPNFDTKFQPNDILLVISETFVE